MANVLGTLFQDIAAAIREKTGESAELKMKPIRFPDKIRAIVTESGAADYDFVIPVDSTVEIACDLASPTVTCPSFVSYRADGGNLIFTGLSVGAGEIVILDGGEEWARYSIRIVRAAENMKFARGYFFDSEYKSYKTFDHNLDTVPDMILVWASSALEGKCTPYAYGFSAAMHAAIPELKSYTAWTNESSYYGVTTDVGFDELTSATAAGYGYIRNVTKTSFTVGSTAYPLRAPAAGNITWIAISGLTRYESVMENVPVTLDFSSGDQTLTAEDGTLIRSALIRKPDTLTPENIAAGVSIAGILGTLTGGDGESDILLPTTEMTFTENPDYGYMWMASPALCELEIGKKYVVTWDGTDYTCEGIDLSAMMEGAVAIGNLAFVGGPDTGEPFALAYDPGAQADGVVYDSNICLTGDTNTHYIKIAKAPKTLTVKTGTVTATASPCTATHGMGFVPDIIMVWVNKPLENRKMDMAIGFSNAMYEAFGAGSWGFLRNALQAGTDANGSPILNIGTMSFSAGFEGTEGAMGGMIRSVTATSFVFGGDGTGFNYGLITTAPYNWMAIGGITG